jgi:hypothetical protein
MGPCVRRDDDEVFPDPACQTTRATRPHSRNAFRARVMPESARPKENEGAGVPEVHAAPAVSCASAQKTAHLHTGSAEAVRHPPRNGFTAYFVLFPVERACCHRRPREACASRELDASIAASEPHDLPVRLRRLVRHFGSAARRKRPSHSDPTNRDDRDTPLIGPERA